MIVVVDGNLERPGAFAVTLAVFAKVGDMLFFTRTAELHLVDVHPEIVLVASIGGVEDAVLSEAHRLHIVEARAARSVAPDGMASIVDPSFRNRSERHSAPPLCYTFALEERTA